MTGLLRGKRRDEWRVTGDGGFRDYYFVSCMSFAYRFYLRSSAFICGSFRPVLGVFGA
jgi:hypothetical protein